MRFASLDLQGLHLSIRLLKRLAAVGVFSANPTFALGCDIQFTEHGHPDDIFTPLSSMHNTGAIGTACDVRRASCACSARCGRARRSTIECCIEICQSSIAGRAGAVKGNANDAEVGTIGRRTSEQHPRVCGGPTKYAAGAGSHALEEWPLFARRRRLESTSSGHLRDAAANGAGGTQSRRSLARPWARIRPEPQSPYRQARIPRHQAKRLRAPSIANRGDDESCDSDAGEKASGTVISSLLNAR
jgi:hypothetical protein